jgi:hypothetical protein
MTKNKNQALMPATALSRALSFVSRGAGRDGLYEMMQVDVKNGTLTVHCFNGTMGVSVQTVVEDQGAGIDAMVNAQAFVSLVSNMNGAVTMSQEARKGLKVECDSVSVSLKGTQSVKSGDRLQRLTDFIRRNNHSATRRNHTGEPVGISHRLVAQIVYLAYRENYPLEFRIESEADITIRTCFPQQPELTITLDAFKNKMDPCSEIQGWWSFLCEIIPAHADIWNIPLGGCCRIKEIIG